MGLNLAITLAATRLEIRNDSQLIVEQIQKEYEEKDERMARYLAMVENRLKKLDEWVIRRVPRKENLKADVLARIAITLPIREVVILPVYLQATPLITPEPVWSANKVDPD